MEKEYLDNENNDGNLEDNKGKKNKDNVQKDKEKRPKKVKINKTNKQVIEEEEFNDDHDNKKIDEDSNSINQINEENSLENNKKDSKNSQQNSLNNIYDEEDNNKEKKLIEDKIGLSKEKKDNIVKNKPESFEKSIEEKNNMNERNEKYIDENINKDETNKQKNKSNLINKEEIDINDNKNDNKISKEKIKEKTVINEKYTPLNEINEDELQENNVKENDDINKNKDKQINISKSKENNKYQPTTLINEEIIKEKSSEEEDLDNNKNENVKEKSQDKKLLIIQNKEDENKNDDISKNDNKDNKLEIIPDKEKYDELKKNEKDIKNNEEQFKENKQKLLIKENNENIVELKKDLKSPEEPEIDKDKSKSTNKLDQNKLKSEDDKENNKQKDKDKDNIEDEDEKEESDKKHKKKRKKKIKVRNSLKRNSLSSIRSSDSDIRNKSENKLSNILNSDKKEITSEKNPSGVSTIKEMKSPFGLNKALDDTKGPSGINLTDVNPISQISQTTNTFDQQRNDNLNDITEIPKKRINMFGEESIISFDRNKSNFFTENPTINKEDKPNPKDLTESDFLQLDREMSKENISQIHENNLDILPQNKNEIQSQPNIKVTNKNLDDVKQNKRYDEDNLDNDSSNLAENEKEDDKNNENQEKDDKNENKNNEEDKKIDDDNQNKKIKFKDEEDKKIVEPKDEFKKIGSANKSINFNKIEDSEDKSPKEKFKIFDSYKKDKQKLLPLYKSMKSIQRLKLNLYKNLGRNKDSASLRKEKAFIFYRNLFSNYLKRNRGILVKYLIYTRKRDLALKNLVRLIFRNIYSALRNKLIDKIDKYNKLLNKSIEVSKEDIPKYDMKEIAATVIQHQFRIYMSSKKNKKLVKVVIISKNVEKLPSQRIRCWSKWKDFKKIKSEKDEKALNKIVRMGKKVKLRFLLDEMDQLQSRFISYESCKNLNKVIRHIYLENVYNLFKRKHLIEKIILGRDDSKSIYFKNRIFVFWDKRSKHLKVREDTLNKFRNIFINHGKKTIMFALKLHKMKLCLLSFVLKK